MSLVAVVGGKNAPGATTAALGLASLWPGARRLLVEADLDGGTLAARFGLGYEPGIVTLAATVRGEVIADAVDGHVQELPGGVMVLCAPTLPEQVTAALQVCARPLASRLARLRESAVVVDLGRAWPTSPAASFAQEADLVVLVSRPRLDEVQQLAARWRAFRSVCRGLGVVLVGDQPYSPDEVRRILDGADAGALLGVLPVDGRGAELLSGERSAPDWAARRAPLVGALRDLAARLAARVGDHGASKSGEALERDGAPGPDGRAISAGAPDGDEGPAGRRRAEHRSEG